MTDQQLEKWCKENEKSENPFLCAYCPHINRCDVYVERHHHCPAHAENDNNIVENERS